MGQFAFLSTNHFSIYLLWTICCARQFAYKTVHSPEPSLGATGQRFVAEDAPLGEADDGLEQAMQVAVSEDGFQRAQLLGDGHGHPVVLRNEKGPVSLPAPLFHDSSMTV